MRAQEALRIIQILWGFPMRKETNADYAPVRRWKGALVNGTLLLVSLGVAYGLCEFILWRYEARLWQRAGIFVQPDPTVDGAAWDVDPGGFERFRWQDDGNSIVHVKSSNPRLVYGLRPGAVISDSIRINSQGFRDYEFSEEKPENVYRIVVLGDSLTFGWLQGQKEIYPKLLEARLNESPPAGRRYEVYNMGVGGYHAGQELELLRSEALRYKPDLIVVGYCTNDNQIGYDAGLWRHFTRSGSRLWDFASLKWMQYRENHAEKPLVERSYEAMAALAAEHKVPLVVLLFPDKGNPDGSMLKQQAELCQRLGLETVSLQEAFQAAGMDTVITDMIHPNTKGHALAAEVLLKHLRPRLEANMGDAQGTSK